MINLHTNVVLCIYVVVCRYSERCRQICADLYMLYGLLMEWNTFLNKLLKMCVCVRVCVRVCACVLNGQLHVCTCDSVMTAFVCASAKNIRRRYDM